MPPLPYSRLAGSAAPAGVRGCPQGLGHAVWANVSGNSDYANHRGRGPAGCEAGRLIWAHPVLCFAVRCVRALCVAHHVAPSAGGRACACALSALRPCLLAALRSCRQPCGPAGSPGARVIHPTSAMYSSDIQCLGLPQLSLL